MPDIDVDDAILDNMIAGESFQVIRRREVVSQKGRSVLSAYLYNALGSVQPTGDNSLVREEGYSLQQKTIEVFTNFPLRGVSVTNQGTTYQPDLIMWKGETFLVKSLDDYTQYGRGFVKADCSSFVYEGPPPIPSKLVLGKLDFSEPQDSSGGGTMPAH